MGPKGRWFRHVWLVAGVALAFVIAGVVVTPVESASKAHASDGTSAQNGQESLATEAGEFRAALDGLAAQAVPFTRQVNADRVAAINALTSAELQTSRIGDQELAQSAQNPSPTSPAAGAERQCASNATSLSNSPLTAGTNQMAAAIHQCVQSRAVLVDSTERQITQIDETATTTVHRDVEKADSALRSIAGIMLQEASVTSGLTVPSSVATARQTVLAAMEVSVADATTATSSSTVNALSDSSQHLSSDMATVNTQSYILVVAMIQG